MIFQMISLLPSALATVPGSPLISSGFCSAMAMFTLAISSSLATYSLVP